MSVHLFRFAANSDFILATFGEELGLAGLMAILLIYGLIVERGVRTALAERALTPTAASTDIVIVSAQEHPRLRGAAMLVAAPTFAAPVVA